MGAARARAGVKAGASAGFTLDAGALIAVERSSSRMNALLRLARANDLAFSIPAAVLAQVWRGIPRQTRVARLLKDNRCQVVPLDELTALAIGRLIGASGHTDVVDVSVALCARERRQSVITSDPDDIKAIDPQLSVVAV